MFRELLIVQVPDLRATLTVERRTALTRTTLAAVVDADAALAVVEGLAGERPDLVELYGGLGASTAVRAGEIVPDAAIGLLGTTWDDDPSGRGVIVESPDADPALDRHVFGDGRARTTVVFVPAADAAPAVARELVDEGADRIELCGGLGSGPAAAVGAAVGGSARVGSVMFGFEALPAAAAYRERFGEAAEALA